MGLDVEFGRDGKERFRHTYHYCPVNYVQLHHKNWLGLFALYRQGKLLDAGGIADQSAKYMDVMMFLDALWNQAQKEAMEGAKQGGGK